MHQKENYWARRLSSNRLSRRRFVGGAAVAGVGAASLGLVGCGDDDNGGGTKTTASGSPAASASAATSATAAPATKVKGGIARFTSANGTYDTMDIDRSRFTPFAVLAGFTNLGVVQYRSFASGELEGAFASKWEQPDAQTLNLTLRDKMFWHDKPPVNGRQATVDDIVQFINRNKGGVLADGTKDPNFYRQAEFAAATTVTATDATHVQIKFDKPNPFFLGTLAGAYSKIQAPEAVKLFEKDYANLKKELIIGTGPYVLTEFTPEGTASLRRFDKYFGDAWIDGMDFFPLFSDNAALQAAFEQKKIDEHAPRTKTVLDALQNTYKGQLENHPSFDANPQAGTYYGGSKPWSDLNLIGAIFRTIDRRALIQQLYQGRAALSGSIPPTQQAFGITEAELIKLPGYLPDHSADLAEAKKMWDAGGGAALGEVIVDIPDIFEGAYSGVSAQITQMLKSNLGNTFTPKIEPYSTITGKLVAKKYGNGDPNIWYGWITDVTKLEPSVDLYNIFNSKGPQFPFTGAMPLPKVDTLTDQLLAELDLEKRKGLTKQIEVELINAAGAGIPYNMVSISNTLRWNYYHGTESAPFVTAHQFGSQAYLDSNDPSWKGRQA